jgi:hypothetical protein
MKYFVHALLSTMFLVSTVAASTIKLPTPVVKFKIDGHFFTTDRVTEITGLNREVGRRLAIFSQVPDEYVMRYSAVPVAVWGIVDLNYRHQIMNTLHSLHGGKNNAVLVRRAALAEMILDHKPTDQAAQWKIGFLIHALGDSYSHVHGEEGNLKAYNEISGHAGDSLRRRDPDKLGEKTLKTYVKYNKALFCALTKPEDRTEEVRANFKNWLGSIEAVKGGVFPSAKSRLAPADRLIADDTFIGKEKDVRQFLSNWTATLKAKTVAIDLASFNPTVHEDCLDNFSN